jgi:hypothetical protein
VYLVGVSCRHSRSGPFLYFCLDGFFSVGWKGGFLFARPLGMSGGNIVNWILLASCKGGGGVCRIVRPPVSTFRQQVLCLLSASFVGVFITK